MSSGYLTVMKIDGDPEELAARYDESSQAMAQVGEDHDLILHAAARTEDGLMVVNLWPSKQESEAASRDQRRMAEAARHGLADRRISSDHYEVENWQVGPAGQRPM
jgi:hypothetical protein